MIMHRNCSIDFFSIRFTTSTFCFAWSSWLPRSFRSARSSTSNWTSTTSVSCFDWIYFQISSLLIFLVLLQAVLLLLQAVLLLHQAVLLLHQAAVTQIQLHLMAIHIVEAVAVAAVAVAVTHLQPHHQIQDRFRMLDRLLNYHT